MKRLLSFIVAVCAFFAVSAEKTMVTLSHDGELSFFTSRYALTEALDSAKNGDTLYLSDGVFLLKDDKCTINKRLSIVGNGYGSHILGSVSLYPTTNPNSWMDAPLFDGVRLDVLNINANGGYNYTNLGKSEIRRTWINTLINGASAATDVTYDKCYIETADFNSLYRGNALLSNSKIGTINGSYSNEINVDNCNINGAAYYPRTMFSSIFNRETVANTSGTHTIVNSVLRVAPTNSNVNTYDCYISEESLLDENLEATVNLIEKGYLGQDGVTEVGVYGGESPFSENPSVPVVDPAKSSVAYDAAGNKLKVSISVKAD